MPRYRTAYPPEFRRQMVDLGNMRLSRRRERTASCLVHIPGGKWRAPWLP
jgi:hypothetical protein